MIRVVVLLGPPGSGKSTIGRELERMGFRWREWEEVILQRWGSRDAFVRAKAEALPELHREIRAWVDTGGSIAAIETTGLSDAPLLDELQRDGVCFIVRLDLSLNEAIQRVASRPRDRHLTDDEDANRQLWHVYDEIVLPHRHADLVIDTGTVGPDRAALLIAAAVEH